MDRIRSKKRLSLFNALLWLLLFIVIYYALGVNFLDNDLLKIKYIALFAGGYSLLFALCRISEIYLFKRKNENLKKIIKYFSKGALIYTFKMFIIALLPVLFAAFLLYRAMGSAFVICFILGVVFALVFLSFPMYFSSRAASKLSDANKESTNLALRLALNSGAACSFYAFGLCIAVFSLLYNFYKDYQVTAGFVLGIAVSVLLANISSAISKHASETASNVVFGYVENIDKKDRRNPLLLLNGLCGVFLKTGETSSDLILSFTAALISAMITGIISFNAQGAYLPLIIASCGIFASIFAILFTRINKIKNPLKTLYFAVFTTCAIFAVLSWYVIRHFMFDNFQLLYSVLTGILGAYLLCFSNIGSIFKRFKPIKSIVNSAVSGLTPTILQIIKEAFINLFVPVGIIVLLISASFAFSGGVNDELCGFYGLTLSILAFISTIGIINTIKTFGIVSANVDLVLDSYETADTERSADETKLLKTIGSRASAVVKNFVSASAILASISVIIGYVVFSEIEIADILNPYVLCAGFTGAVVPFIFCAFVLISSSKTAKCLVFEVKKQFRNFPQILRFEMRPDYEQCVSTALFSSLIQTIFYSIILVVVFVAVAINFKQDVLISFVWASILVSCMLLFVSTTAGTVISCARKYFEFERKTQANQEEYEVLLASENVVCTFCDLIIPVLRVLIKFLTILLLTLAPLFI